MVSRNIVPMRAECIESAIYAIWNKIILIHIFLQNKAHIGVSMLTYVERP